MELRSTRSRSKTPAMLRASLERDVLNTGNHVEYVTRSTRSTTTRTFENYVESESSQSSKPVKMKNRKESSISRRKYITSDYSSEEGEYEVSSTRHISQNAKNQLIEDNIIKANGNSEVSALKVYKEAGEYWNKFPKTDYTYSRHSKDRIELAPGVVCMPNMSRNSIHSYSSEHSTSNKETNTDSFLTKEVNFVGNYSQNSSLHPRSLFTNNNYDENKEYTISKSSSYRRKVTVVTRIQTIITTIFTTMFSWVYRGYEKQNSWLIWLVQKIHKFVSRVMLLDSQLLQGGNKKISSVILLCLLPLILFGGWWLLSGLSHAIHGAYFNNTDTPAPPIPNIEPRGHVKYDNKDVSSEDGVVINGGKISSENLVVHQEKTVDMSDKTIGNIAVGSKASGLVGALQEPVMLTPIIQEKVVKITEKVLLEPPSALEIANELSDEQLQQIAGIIRSSFKLDTSVNEDSIIQKILASPNIQNLINNYNTLSNNIAVKDNKLKRDVSEELVQKQELVINNLKDEIDKIRLDLMDLEKARNDEISRVISQIRMENAQTNVRFSNELKKCCRNSIIHMENHVMRVLTDILGVPHEYRATQKDVSQWLHTVFVAKQDLEGKLLNLTGNLRSDFDGVVQRNGKLLMDEITGKISLELNKRLQKLEANSRENAIKSSTIKLESVSDEHIKGIVEEVLALYDADKTGLVDYAMEPSGGQIISTRCTEGYQAGTAVVSVFGIPLWYTSNTPRTVITPGINPGECWAFQNFPGFLVIKLTAPVTVEAFSYEHVSKHLIPNSRIDSSPKEFHVYGMQNEDDREPVLIGEYFYDYNGKPLQYFAAQNVGLTFRIIELRVISNHGNPNYTCLYRFRVHGSLNAEPT